MNRPTDRPYTVGLYLNSCKGLKLSLQELTMMTYGTVMDMLIERQNDECEYATLATQDDFDRF